MYHVGFGGGLGDVINQCYFTGNYKLLDSIVQKTAISIRSHNKFTSEIFTQHPKHDLFEIFQIRYGGYPRFPDGLDFAKTMRNLARAGYRTLPSAPAPRADDVVFYPSQSDQALLSELPPQFISFQPFSGTSDRDIPAQIVKGIDHYSAQIAVPLVVIGRNYERRDKVTREEFSGSSSVVNYIDKLSVPGTIELLKRSSLFIGGHSSMNLAAWHNRVPNYILFAEHIRQKHFRPGQLDEWSFGRHYPETEIDLFSAFSREKIERLLKI
jgi:hypothetical protein